MPTRIAACDLGKVSASMVVGHLGEDGALAVDDAEYVIHDGQPFATFVRWYLEKDVASCAALGATGVYAEQLQLPAQVVPEDACQEVALGRLDDLPDTLNLVSIGGRGYSALSRLPAEGNGNGTVTAFTYRYLENDKCSSGTGENIQKMAARFGMTVDEADALAMSAETLIPITARCSVFAKSEMTHYANQGKPANELFRGFFTSVARNAAALLARNGLEAPVVLIGGCAGIASIRRALSATLGREVIVLDDARCFEAVGAALLAAESLKNGRASTLPADPQEVLQLRPKRFAVLPVARSFADQVTIMPEAKAPEDWAAEPAVLGLDLGSTGAKAVLTSLATGQQLIDVYDRTQGNPVGASQRLIGAILEQGHPNVRAIGITGSGREAVATLLRTTFPDADRVVVLNEIVAHATAAMRCDVDGGEDLSVIEIGGQDAKFARLSGGRIVESDMNQACSAGTGSFLEEQATLYDVSDIRELGRMAMAAERPPDLGQMCTVYVADAAAEALKDGFELGDIFAGFQYSIIHNYLNRVMGQRTLGKRIFFQGKPASSESLAWTLAAVTGRDIVVPPNPGAMGAWGIGICTIDELGREALEKATPIDLTEALRASIVERSEFTCRDKDCQTLCPIERTTIQLGREKKVAISGGACPKFEVATASQPKLDKDAPNPFETRNELLTAFASPTGDGIEVAVPVTGATAAHVPWLATLVGELGLKLKLLRPTSKSLAAGEQLCNSFDSCGPAKIAHAVCDTEVRWLLFPKILDVLELDGPGGQSCVTEQSMPEIVQLSLTSRGRDVTVLKAVLSFAEGPDSPSLIQALQPMVKQLGLEPDRLQRAVTRAAEAQRRYHRQLVEACDEAIVYARREDIPIVLVCGALHVIHDPAIAGNIPNLLRQNGAMAIPMDGLQIDQRVPRMPKVYWGDANRALRAAALAREMNDVFPLEIASFGCGPASFAEQFFQAVLEGYPHTVLESDGHGGTAGFVTRIQAFLQSVRQYRADADARPFTDNDKALSYLEPTPPGGSYLDRDVRYVFLSGTEYIGSIFAAVYRSHGYHAEAAPPLSHANMVCGQQDCSGKECLSYQMVWGAFREYLEKNPPDRPTRLVQISGEMCRAGVFGIKDRITLAKMGLDDRVTVTALKIAGGPGMSARVWCGLVATDIIRQLYLYYLAVEPSAGDAERLYRHHSGEVLRLLEQPTLSGAKVVTQMGWQWVGLRTILEAASAAFTKLASTRPAFTKLASGRTTEHLRTLFVSGDLMTKGCDFANGGVFRYLASKGIRVVAEPMTDFMEYLARAHPRLLFGRNSKDLERTMYRANMVSLRNSLYALIRPQHPWLPVTDVRAALERADAVIDSRTNGGAAFAVGSVLHHWDRGGYDGVMLTSCWGCDNGLIMESLLRHNREIPCYFFYDDGSPIDERRINAFAFRLKRQPARNDTPRLTSPRPVDRLMSYVRAVTAPMLRGRS